MLVGHLPDHFYLPLARLVQPLEPLPQQEEPTAVQVQVHHQPVDRLRSLLLRHALLGQALLELALKDSDVGKLIEIVSIGAALLAAGDPEPALAPQLSEFPPNILVLEFLSEYLMNLLVVLVVLIYIQFSFLQKVFPVACETLGVEDSPELVANEVVEAAVLPEDAVKPVILKLLLEILEGLEPVWREGVSEETGEHRPYHLEQGGLEELAGEVAAVDLAAPEAGETDPLVALLEEGDRLLELGQVDELALAEAVVLLVAPQHVLLHHGLLVLPPHLNRQRAALHQRTGFQEGRAIDLLLLLEDAQEEGPEEVREAVLEGDPLLADDADVAHEPQELLAVGVQVGSEEVAHVGEQVGQEVVLAEDDQRAVPQAGREHLVDHAVGVAAVEAVGDELPAHQLLEEAVVAVPAGQPAAHALHHPAHQLHLLRVVSHVVLLPDQTIDSECPRPHPLHQLPFVSPLPDLPQQH